MFKLTQCFEWHYSVWSIPSINFFVSSSYSGIVSSSFWKIKKYISFNENGTYQFSTCYYCVQWTLCTGYYVYTCKLNFTDSFIQNALLTWISYINFIRTLRSTNSKTKWYWIKNGTYLRLIIDHVLLLYTLKSKKKPAFQFPVKIWNLKTKTISLLLF